MLHLHFVDTWGDPGRYLTLPIPEGIIDIRCHYALNFLKDFSTPINHFFSLTEVQKSVSSRVTRT
jgi:hypothetical protein